jgi:4-hydroxybenzoate polyprenyltransferase
LTPFTDIPEGSLKARLPKKLAAYAELARLDRPIGTWLLLFPCFWALALSHHAFPPLYAYFAIGAFAMRGAGCTVNDLIDRKIDAEVERTKGRPLPSGRLGVAEAMSFLMVQLGVGLTVLLQLDRLAIELGCASLLLVVAYPLMKRITWWPQLFLGLTFNWGCLLGWAAATGTIELPAIFLYLGGIAWTLGYDTIYAYQDLGDDSRIGVRSTARRLQRFGKIPVAIAYAVALALVGIAGHAQALGVYFYAILAATACFCAWMVAAWKPSAPADCLKRFKANAWIGLGLFAAIAFGCW